MDDVQDFDIYGDLIDDPSQANLDNATSDDVGKETFVSKPHNSKEGRKHISDEKELDGLSNTPGDDTSGADMHRTLLEGVQKLETKADLMDDIYSLHTDKEKQHRKEVFMLQRRIADLEDGNQVLMKDKTQLQHNFAVLLATAKKEIAEHKAMIMTLRKQLLQTSQQLEVTSSARKRCRGFPVSGKQDKRPGQNITNQHETDKVVDTKQHSSTKEDVTQLVSSSDNRGQMYGNVSEDRCSDILKGDQEKWNSTKEPNKTAAVKEYTETLRSSADDRKSLPSHHNHSLNTKQAGTSRRNSSLHGRGIDAKYSSIRGNDRDTRPEIETRKDNHDTICGNNASDLMNRKDNEVSSEIPTKPSRDRKLSYAEERQRRLSTSSRDSKSQRALKGRSARVSRNEEPYKESMRRHSSNSRTRDMEGKVAHLSRAHRQSSTSVLHKDQGHEKFEHDIEIERNQCSLPAQASYSSSTQSAKMLSDSEARFRESCSNNKIAESKDASNIEHLMQIKQEILCRLDATTNCFDVTEKVKTAGLADVRTPSSPSNERSLPSSTNSYMRMDDNHRENSRSSSPKQLHIYEATSPSVKNNQSQSSRSDLLDVNTLGRRTLSKDDEQTSESLKSFSRDRSRLKPSTDIISSEVKHSISDSLRTKMQRIRRSRDEERGDNFRIGQRTRSVETKDSETRRSHVSSRHLTTDKPLSRYESKYPDKRAGEKRHFSSEDRESASSKEKTRRHPRDDKISEKSAIRRQGISRERMANQDKSGRQAAGSSLGKSCDVLTKVSVKETIEQTGSQNASLSADLEDGEVVSSGDEDDSMRRPSKKPNLDRRSSTHQDSAQSRYLKMK